MNRYDNDVPAEDAMKESETDELQDKEFIAYFKAALKSARDHHDRKLKSSWARNYRAFQNRHFNGSKYDTYRYRNRSKIFKPKTRAAVRKNDATAAQAMFSTEDVVSITAERPSDKLQSTTARFLHEVLNYRLDRSNKWAGPNWFLTAMGARQDTQITGVCISKQHWEYEERVVEERVKVTTEVPALDGQGFPIVDSTTGETVMEMREEDAIQERIEIVRDRLMITVFPPEHALIDVTADWRDPIQEGGCFIAVYPMRLDDVEDIIRQGSDRNRMGGRAWRKIDMEKLKQARTEKSQNAAAVRRARQDGIDQYDGVYQGTDNDTVWLYECFHRDDGEDWHFWMLGENTLLSDPRPTIESYPEHKGERPYVRGLGALEAHKVYPMAPVESWQPMQIEMNDITNLSLDALKMAISPITKIKRGAGVDLKQVQNRGPDAAIMVSDHNDVDFARAPDPSANGYNYVSVLANDFDELAGVFSGGSVQSNRTLNETVGGMQLLSQSASALTEFDLRVFVETWVEPALAQCIRCIKYYESDELIIQVAGERAGLIENIAADDTSGALEPQKEQAEAEQETNPFEEVITVQQVLENLDAAQVTVRVNVGIGALDGTQKMAKFMGATKATMELMPALEEQGITLNAASIMQEIWGLSGYKDADRFFIKAPEKGDVPPPEVQKEMMKQKADMEKKQMELQAKSEIEGGKINVQMSELALERERFAYQKQMDRMQMAVERQDKALSDIMALLQQITSGEQADKDREARFGTR